MCESGKREERSDELMERCEETENINSRTGDEEERERAEERGKERESGKYIIFLRRPPASAHKLFFFSSIICHTTGVV